MAKLSIKRLRWFKSLAGVRAGSWTMERFLGNGKLGVVYLARKDPPLQRLTVALKLHPGPLPNQWANEIEKVRQLNLVSRVVHLHEVGTATLHAADRTEAVMYTCWDYIHPGRNLRDYLGSVDSVSLSFVTALAEQILFVLHACQSAGFHQHGDLHAGNVLVGEPGPGDVEVDLTHRLPVYVADFGYGATGQLPSPKDDYAGLATILNLALEKLDWAACGAADRAQHKVLRAFWSKVLRESDPGERLPALEIIRQSREVRDRAARATNAEDEERTLRVGDFQISEMLGESWHWWRQLFVPTVPAASEILVRSVPTVLTGPRGCGKTMLFRRMSERVVLECGPVTPGETAPSTFALFVSANDLPDAFADFPESPPQEQRRRLIAYFHLCVLDDFLQVLAARTRRLQEPIPGSFVEAIRGWVTTGDVRPLVDREETLAACIAEVQAVKRDFALGPLSSALLRGESEMGLPNWLDSFATAIQRECPWTSARTFLVFVDDYSMPRVSRSMQRVLNTVVCRRSGRFTCKVSTESATTFETSDVHGKIYQDGDDYRLVDLAEETLFMSEESRSHFLRQVFDQRLAGAQDVAEGSRTLDALLGHSGHSKTDFARCLRDPDSVEASGQVSALSQRRGRSRSKALYYGSDVFCQLWSGDTRMMIQLLQDLCQAAVPPGGGPVSGPIVPEMQDHACRSRGSLWLESHTRALPTAQADVDAACEALRAGDPGFCLVGNSYGVHLKAVVEAFINSARALLLGPTYRIQGEKSAVSREVPRMAFRIEVIDDLRLEPLATQVYLDLIRYGMFLRDARGKSVRGAMVPRLYLRRLLLPHARLALSKRDSVQWTSAEFNRVLTRPDAFKDALGEPRRSQPGGSAGHAQGTLTFVTEPWNTPYNDLPHLAPGSPGDGPEQQPDDAAGEITPTGGQGV